MRRNRNNSSPRSSPLRSASHGSRSPTRHISARIETFPSPLPYLDVESIWGHGTQHTRSRSVSPMWTGRRRGSIPASPGWWDRALPSPGPVRSRSVSVTRWAHSSPIRSHHAVVSNALVFHAEEHMLVNEEVLTPPNEQHQHRCDICGKTFARKFNFDLHMRTHTGDKPFACNICGKSFAQKSVLNRHTETHENTPKFICSTCGKGFKQRSNLRRHENTHM